MDSDVKKLFRKGLRKVDAKRKQARLRKHNPACLRPGENLYYETIAEKDATVLRRMLSTGPAVGMLSIGNISLNAFRTAFDELEACAELEIVYLGVDCEGEDLSIDLSAAFGRLDSLELSCHNAGRGFAKELARYIQENESLTELVIWDSCGGDEGATAIIKALGRNRSLEKFTLAEMELSPKMLLAFAEMLATNSTLKLLDIKSACAVEKDRVVWLLTRNRYVDVFKRLEIEWPDQLLRELAALVRSKACYSKLSVSVASIADEEALRVFCDAVAADTKLRELFINENECEDRDDESGDTEDENEDADEGRDDTESKLVDTVEEREDAVDEPEDRDGAVEDTVAALADGVSPTKRKRTLRGRLLSKRMKHDNERQLVSIIDAVKGNRSIRKFYMGAELVTPEMATSLSELFAVNQTLTHVHVCSSREMSSSDVDTILRGLRKNYTMTALGVYSKTNESRTYLETYALSVRNSRRVNKAARFVIYGDEVSDQQGISAPKEVRSSARLVKKVYELMRRPRSLLERQST
ncbi:hypothetical protein MTO96_044147 [Rhipicephalus appendiculatus]